MLKICIFDEMYLCRYIGIHHFSKLCNKILKFDTYAAFNVKSAVAVAFKSALHISGVFSVGYNLITVMKYENCLYII